MDSASGCCRRSAATTAIRAGASVRPSSASSRVSWSAAAVSSHGPSSRRLLPSGRDPACPVVTRTRPLGRSGGHRWCSSAEPGSPSSTTSQRRSVQLSQERNASAACSGWSLPCPATASAASAYPQTTASSLVAVIHTTRSAAPSRSTRRASCAASRVLPTPGGPTRAQVAEGSSHSPSGRPASGRSWNGPATVGSLPTSTGAWTVPSGPDASAVGEGEGGGGAEGG